MKYMDTEYECPPWVIVDSMGNYGFWYNPAGARWPRFITWVPYNEAAYQYYYDYDPKIKQGYNIIPDPHLATDPNPIPPPLVPQPIEPAPVVPQPIAPAPTPPPTDGGGGLSSEQLQEEKLKWLAAQIEEIKAGMGVAPGGTSNMANIDQVVEQLAADLRMIKSKMGAGHQAANLPRLFISGWQNDNDVFVQALRNMELDPALNARIVAGTITPGELLNAIYQPGILEKISRDTGWPIDKIKNVASKVLSTGLSGALMALTGNFPVAAMAYFASDRILGAQGNRSVFGGIDNGGVPIIDGQIITPMDIEIPNGLPNEIFGRFRFICYDRLGRRWWPSDEIKPLAYDSNEPYRWLILDRLSRSVYKANLIKQPRIYLD